MLQHTYVHIETTEYNWQKSEQTSISTNGHKESQILTHMNESHKGPEQTYTHRPDVQSHPSEEHFTSSEHSPGRTDTDAAALD